MEQFVHPLEINPLDEHDVANFDCGDEALNAYLLQNARQHQRKMISRTYVATAANAPNVIIGFITLTIRAMVPTVDLPLGYQRRLPRTVPGYTLARLAIDKRWQGQGFGSDLLMYAIDRVRESAMNVAGWGFFVDAKNDGVAKFYERFGFVRMPSHPLTLFMPIADLPR